MKSVFLVILLLTAYSVRADEICVGEVCRTVDTAPLVKDFTQNLNAAPRPAGSRRVADPRFWLVTAADVGVSVASTRALVRCRADHGIGPCWDGGYGEFRAREVLRQGLTGVLVLCSYEIKKIEDRDDDHHFWWTLQAANAGWNSGALIRNRLHDFPPKEKD